MKKLSSLVLVFSLLVLVSGGASAMEIQGAFGGPDYFGGGVVLEDMFEIAEQDVGLVAMGMLNEDVNTNNQGFEALAGLHWDKVKFGDTVTDSFNYQFGLGYNTAGDDGRGGNAGLTYFAKTSVELTDSIALGGMYSSSMNGALTTNISF